MSANVSNLFICPKCSNGISGDEKPEICPGPSCGYRFPTDGEGLTKEYFWPKNFYEQLYELVQQDMEKFKDKPISEMIPGISKEKEQDLIVSNQLRHK